MDIREHPLDGVVKRYNRIGVSQRRLALNLGLHELHGFAIVVCSLYFSPSFCQPSRQSLVGRSGIRFQTHSFAEFRSRLIRAPLA